MEKTIIQTSTPKRSIAKAVIYRIAAVVIHFSLILIILGEVVTSIYLTLAVNIINIIIYYANERVWLKIKWGKIEKKC